MKMLQDLFDFNSDSRIFSEQPYGTRVYMELMTMWRDLWPLQYVKMWLLKA